MGVGKDFEVHIHAHHKQANLGASWTQYTSKSTVHCYWPGVPSSCSTLSSSCSRLQRFLERKTECKLERGSTLAFYLESISGTSVGPGAKPPEAKAIILSSLAASLKHNMHVRQRISISKEFIWKPCCEASKNCRNLRYFLFIRSYMEFTTRNLTSVEGKVLSDSYFVAILN